MSVICLYGRSRGADRVAVLCTGGGCPVADGCISAAQCSLQHAGSDWRFDSEGVA